MTIAGEMGITSTDGGLTISALGDLMVNANINVGANILRLRAGLADGDDVAAGQTGVITFMATTIELQAAGFGLEQDGEVFTDPAPATFLDAAGVAALPAIVQAFYLGTPLAADGTTPLVQGDLDWAVGLAADETLGMGAAFMIMAGDLLNGELRASSSIMLNAGTEGITFATDVLDVTLNAPMVTITAGSIDLGTRSLTIIADGGTLTLTGVSTITGTDTAALSLTGDDHCRFEHGADFECAGR